jgi:hypothetical protein
MSTDSDFKNITVTFNNETSSNKKIGFKGISTSDIFYSIDNPGVKVELTDFPNLIKFKLKGSQEEFVDYADELIPNHNISIKLRNKLSNIGFNGGASESYYWKFEFIISNKKLSESDK